MEVNNSLLFWEEMAAPYGRKKLCDVREMTENEFFVRGCTVFLDAMEKLCIQCGWNLRNKRSLMLPGKTILKFIIVK